MVCLSEAGSICDSSRRRIAEVMSVIIDTPRRSRKKKERFWDWSALREKREKSRRTAGESAAGRDCRRLESSSRWGEWGLEEDQKKKKKK